MLSPNGSISLAQWAPSPDAKLLAYGLSEGGADWQTIHVRDIATGKDLPDEVQVDALLGALVDEGHEGILLLALPRAAEEQGARGGADAARRVYYHRVGTPQSQDALVYERTDQPDWFIGGGVTEDGRYLLITMSQGADNNNRLLLRRPRRPAAPEITRRSRRCVETRRCGVRADRQRRRACCYVRSDQDAPNRQGRRHRPAASPTPAAWKTIVAETQGGASRASRRSADRLVAHVPRRRAEPAALFGLDGAAPAGEIALPGAGHGRRHQRAQGSTRVCCTRSRSPLLPTTVYRYDLATRSARAVRAGRSCRSTRAGTRRSSCSRRRRTARASRSSSPQERTGAATATTRRCSTATAASRSATLPTYRPDVPAWLERGGVWVTANMRGGAEYGEAWHKAGHAREEAERLRRLHRRRPSSWCKEKYTSPAKLGDHGRLERRAARRRGRWSSGRICSPSRCRRSA